MQPVTRLTIEIPPDHLVSNIIWDSSDDAPTSPLTPKDPQPSRYYPITRFESQEANDEIRTQIIALLALLDSVKEGAASD